MSDEHYQIALFLISLGYRQLPDGRWQDKHAYQPPKDKMEAYEYEMGVFQ